MGIVQITTIIVEAAACLAAFTVATVAILKEYINRPKTPCDTCEKLIRKRRKNLNEYRYICELNSGFDNPPQYCRDYCKREVVKVVRCRECYFRALDGVDVPICTGAMAYSSTPDDWFCAAGKPKDGGQDDENT